MKAAQKIRDSVECSHCHNRMELLRIKKYTGRYPLVLVILGVFCSLFFFGALVGIPILLSGIYMAKARETISHCSNCGHYFKVFGQEDGSE